jgi:HSP20 family protein
MAEELAKAPAKSQLPARPSDLFGSLRDEIDRVFSDFDRGIWGFPVRWRQPNLDVLRGSRLSSVWRPSVDIAEKNDKFELTVDLPGIDEKNIEVKFSDGVLTVKGTREEHKEEQKKDYHVSERQFGAFERSFQVPESVDNDKIDAQFKNGVLTISLPKKPEAKKAEKKISVNGS